MHAMILAAGRGERMRPLTDQTPKPLLKVGDHPLIVWHVKRLAEQGFIDIVINHAWLGEQIEATLGDGKQYGVNIQYSPEKLGGLETAGGIAHALPLLGNKPFLVINSDILTNFSLQQLKQYDMTDKLAHLIMVPNPTHHPQGDWGISHGFADQSVTPYYTFSGIGLYHPALFHAVPINEKVALLPLFLAAMAKKQITAEYYTGQWMDIGTPERLALANAMTNHFG